MSIAEKYIWKALLSRNKMGVKFKRQRPIDNYIVDFFSQEIGLIIEVDGSSHFTKGEYDFARQKRLESLGFVFLRFEECEVINNISDIHRVVSHTVYCLKKQHDKTSP